MRISDWSSDVCSSDLYGWVPPGVAHYQSQLPEWAHWTQAQRVAEAHRLYAASGYTADRPLQIELRYNKHADHKRIATVIAAMWKPLMGVEIGRASWRERVWRNG